MSKGLLLTAALYLCLSFMEAQEHCRYDSRGIIVVNPFDAGSYTLVEGLQMFLIDKDEEPKRALSRSQTPGDVVYFHRNPEEQKNAVRIGEKEARFPNAKNYYVQTLGKYSSKNYKHIRIIDTMKNRPGGSYGELRVQLNDSNLMELCYDKPFWHVPQWVSQHIVRVPLERP